MSPPQVVGQILGILGAGSFVGDLISFVSVVNVDHIALLGKFDPVFIGESVKPPEDHAYAVGPAMIEAVSAAFLADVLNIQVSLSAQGLDGRVEHCLSLVDIFLIDWNGLGRWRHLGLSDRESRQDKDKDR